MVRELAHAPGDLAKMLTEEGAGPKPDRNGGKRAGTLINMGVPAP